MTDKKFIKLIKETIVDYFNSHVDKTDHKTITEDAKPCRILKRWRQQLYRTECITK